MKFSIGLTVVATLFTYGGIAQAYSLTQEEKASLCTTLTCRGANPEGNEEGTIPPYEWGQYEQPDDYVEGSGQYTALFPDEEPRLTITAEKMAEYADKLSAGTEALLTKYPKTFRLEVYPTHRTFTAPKWVLERTKKLAGTAELKDNGNSLANIHAAVPFPIPKTGQQAMWNHLLRFVGIRHQAKYWNLNVDTSGTRTVSTAAVIDEEFPYWDRSDQDTEIFFQFMTHYFAPNRRAGEHILGKEPLDYGDEARIVYQYLPGLRRVKLAPSFAFDTPNTGTGGVATWDDAWTFNGSMERYNWKLLGKREVYVPYNNCAAFSQTPVEGFVKPNHLNPDKIRWELHRVWVVEANLKPDARHIYHRRRFYLDEDSWVALMSDSWDARGEIYKTIHALACPMYDVPGAPEAMVIQPGTQPYYDLISGAYTMQGLPTPDGYWKIFSEPMPDSAWSPAALSRYGVR